MIVIDETERMYQKSFVAYFKVQSQHLPGDTEKKLEEAQSI
jgi:hypothetical protein